MMMYALSSRAVRNRLVGCQWCGFVTIAKLRTLAVWALGGRHGGRMVPWSAGSSHSNRPRWWFWMEGAVLEVNGGGGGTFR
jgi:hypothetical protein